MAFSQVQRVGGSLASSSIPSFVWVWRSAWASLCPVSTSSWEARTSLSWTWRMACGGERGQIQSKSQQINHRRKAIASEETGSSLSCGRGRGHHSQGDDDYLFPQVVSSVAVELPNVMPSNNIFTDLKVMGQIHCQHWPILVFPKRSGQCLFWGIFVLCDWMLGLDSCTDNFQ